MYFFTEPGSLSSTINTQYFGPVLFGPFPDPNDPTDLFYTYDKKVFNVTTVFGLTAPAKVFACQDSMMIVQQYVDITTGLVNADLVNIILKPIKGLDISFTPVKYYVYRGVLKSSFISGTAITPDDPNTKTEFITKFWKGWRNQKTVLGQPTLPDPTPQSFGFDLSLANTTLIEEIFNSDQSANTAINDLQAIKVDEGEWIGNFGINNIGFEIVIDVENFKVDLEYIRKSNFIIDVTTLANVTPITNESKFNLKSQREVVLNFVDPAAFFGMHYEAGISLAGTSAPKKNDLLYSDIVNKFFNKDCLYINLESEKGFSYNFYDNYGDSSHINVKLTKSTASVAVVREFDYGVDRFPLIIFRTAAEFQNPDFNRTKLELRLRVDDNLAPLLFFQNSKLIGANSLKKSNNFIDDKSLIDNDPANAGWTIEITLELPTVQFNSAKVNMAYIVRLQYFRQKENSASPNTVFKNTSYLDAVFGGINLPASSVKTAFNNIKNTKRTLVNGNNFTYVSETGVYIDPDKVVVYANINYPFKQSKEVYPLIDFSVFKFNTLGSKSPVLPKHILYNKWQVDQAVGVTLDILEIVAYNLDIRPTNVENIYFLGLTRAEFDILKNLTGVSNQHQRYIAFEEIPNQQDVTNGTPYKKYKLKIQGLNTDGIVSVVAPSTDIFVFGSCLNMLCSKDFTASTNLPNLLPDPGTMKEFDFAGRFDYDSNDPFVTNLFTNGQVNVGDKDTNQRISQPSAGLLGEVHFPSESAGAAVPSSKKAEYPLIVIIPGNGHRYTDYRDLCNYLALNGFIAASISTLIYTGANVFLLHDSSSIHANYYFFETEAIKYIYNNNPGIAISADYAFEKLTTVRKDEATGATILHLLSWIKGVDFDIRLDPTTSLPTEITFLVKAGNHGMGALGRANLLYSHLKIIKTKFGAKVQNNLGILGHSRGGESVVRVAKDISSSSAPPDLKNLKAIISLAPTDQYDVEILTQNIPYFVLYGSKDGDVSGYSPAGPRGTGFALLDRTNNNTEKTMSFVYGATHNGFITNNNDYKDASVGLAPTDVQQKITLAYTNAFFRMHLKNEIIWKSIFSANQIPISIPKKEIYQQFKKMNAAEIYKINNFESGISIGTSPGQASFTTPANIVNGDLYTLDSYSPHDTKGLIVSWKSSDILSFYLSISGIDITNFYFVSFRICYLVKLPSLYSKIDHLKVELVDFSNNKYAIGLTKKIPEPDLRKNVAIPLPTYIWKDSDKLTKSALMTIRIPLNDYAIGGVDLTKIKEMSFIFPTTVVPGDITIDDIEFTK